MTLKKTGISQDMAPTSFYPSSLCIGITLYAFVSVASLLLLYTCLPSPFHAICPLPTYPATYHPQDHLLPHLPYLLSLLWTGTDKTISITSLSVYQQILLGSIMVLETIDRRHLV